MDRLTLKTRVEITGTSPRAGWIAPKQHIVLRPLTAQECARTGRDGLGWYWQTQDNTLVPIDMSMVHAEGETLGEQTSAIKLRPLQHYLYFQRGPEILQCVEHVLALKALGIDGVVIKAIGNTTWIPYAGGAKNLWNAVEGKLTSDGHLTPMALQADYIYKWTDPKFHVGDRSTGLDSTRNREGLFVDATIDYPSLAGLQRIERQVPFGDPGQMRDILESRPLLQPIFVKLRPLLKILGWRHAKSAVAKSPKPTPDELREITYEIALHRVLDLLGVASVLAEPGAHLAGKLVTNLGDHRTDLRLLAKLLPAARELHPHLFEPIQAAPSRPPRNRVADANAVSRQDY